MSGIYNSISTLNHVQNILSKAQTLAMETVQNINSGIAKCSQKWSDDKYIACAESVQNSTKQILQVMYAIADISDEIDFIKAKLEKYECINIKS